MVPAVLENRTSHNFTKPQRSKCFSPVDQSLSDLSDLKHRWGLDVIPVLPGERINDLLLDTLLASDLEALVFAYSHLLYFWKRDYYEF